MLKGIGVKFEAFRPQLTAVFFGCLGVLGNGMEYGWSSPAIPLLLSPESPVALSAASEGPYWVESLYALGSLLAMPLTCWCADGVGRKGSLLLGGSLGACGWALTALTQVSGSVWQLYAARLVAGMGANVQFVCLPMYIGEVSQADVRGFLGTLVQVLTLSGVLVSYVCVPRLPLWGSSCVGLAVSLLQLMAFSTRPESPYHVRRRRGSRAAESALRRLRAPRADLADELREIAEAVDRPGGRLRDLLTDPANRRASLVMCLLNCGQHLAASSVMVMNVQSIAAAGDGEHGHGAGNAPLLFGAAMLASALVGSVLVDRCGRKPLLVSSYAASALCLLGLALHRRFGGGEGGWLPVALCALYAAAFKYGLGLVPIAMSGELFPAPLKALGMVLADLWFPLSAAVSIRLYYLLGAACGWWTPLLLFSACAAACAVLVHLFVPETKGLSLRQIQMLLDKQRPDNTPQQTAFS